MPLQKTFIKEYFYRYTQIKLEHRNKLKPFFAIKYQNKNIAFIVDNLQRIPPLYNRGDSDAAYGHIDGSDSHPIVIIIRSLEESNT